MSYSAPSTSTNISHDDLSSLLLLQQIIETLPVRVFWKDTDLRYLGCNSLFARDAGGQSPADIIGKLDYDLAWHEQAELYRTDDQQVMRENKVKLAYQEPQTTADGRHIWLRTSKVPLMDRAGQVIGVLGIYDDITERMSSELEYRSILNTTQDGFVTTDLNGQFLDVNDTYCAMLGYSRHELLALSVKDIDIIEDEQEAKQHIQNVVQFGHDRFESKQRHKDGHALTVEVSVNFVNIAQGMMVAFIRDVSERKKLEHERWINQFALDNSNVAITRVNSSGRVVYANKAVCDMLCYNEAEMLSLSVWDWDAELSADTWSAAWQFHRSQEQRFQLEKTHTRKDGSLIPVEVTASYINHDGNEYSLAVVQDMSKHKAAEALIWKQANFDSLTGLPNRQMFYDRLNHEIKKSHREALPMALLFLDLDRFKEVNDSLGHDMGDLLLQEATKRIQRCVREADTVSRLGGDEFTIILGSLKDFHAVERITEAVLTQLAMPFDLAGSLAYISVSIGITFYPDDALTADVLIKNADQAMYAAKAQGRNRSHYFTPQMQEAAQKRLMLINDLHIAVEKQQFSLCYQPIVELSTGMIHKAEALVRWHHPTQGMISPADFIPAAEETDLIVRLGQWVFLETTRQLSLWHQVCPKFQLSINTSPLQFQRQATLSEDWIAHLNLLNLPHNSLVVEITEGLLMDVSSNVKDQLLGFGRGGIQVAMDDFGTGYSSLSYLKKFDIDYIKIDQSFVRNMESDCNDLALCEAIIVMAHKLGISVIAEGIETQAQSDLLVAMGCDYGQGYLFSRPIVADAFLALLESQR